MARVSIVPPTGKPEGPTRHTSGSSTGSKNYSNNASREQRANDSIAEQVKNSPAYLSAYEVLSAEPNQSWLQRLEMIPYSVQDATSTFFDEFGFTHNRDDKQQANYQYCMQQIAQLMNDYQSWKNSLPVTQVQQFADAGINAAITGNGVNGSNMSPGTAPTVNPSSMQSAQPIDIITNAASFILDASTGLASVASQFKQLGVSARSQNFNEEQALLEFRKYARENGMQIPAESTWNDILTGSWFDPNAEATHSNALLRKLLTHHQNGALMGALAQLYPSAAEWYFSDDGSKLTHTGISYAPVGIDATSQALLDLYKNEKNYELSVKQFNSLIADENFQQEQSETITAGLRRAEAEYHEKQEKIKSELLDTLSKSVDPADKLLLMKILWQNTINTVELERKQNEFFSTGINLGPLGQIDIIPK